MLLSNCQNNRLSENIVEDTENGKSLERNEKLKKYLVDTNDIENMITLHEYLKREHQDGLYSEERLQQLKDSINYDSILKNRELPVFEKFE